VASKPHARGHKQILHRCERMLQAA
jgi:hypothetical protein